MVNYQIGKNVTLGKNVKIGDFSVIEDNVTIGDFSEVGCHTIISNGCCLGNHVTIGNFCSIGCNPSYRGLDLKYNSVVTIGDYSVILDFCVVTRASVPGNATMIGKKCILASHCYVGHDCIISDAVFMSTKSILAGHSSIGVGSTVGANSFIHQKLRIGSYCMIGACSKVVRDVPDFLLVDGIPALVKKINSVGLERNNLLHLQDDLKAFYNSYFNLKDCSADFRFPDEISSIDTFIMRSEEGITRCGAKLL